MKRSEPNTVQPTTAPAPTAEATTPAPSASVAEQLRQERQNAAVAEIKRLRQERERKERELAEAKKRQEEYARIAAQREKELEAQRAAEAEQRRIMAMENAKRERAEFLSAYEAAFRLYSPMYQMMKEAYDDATSYNSRYPVKLYQCERDMEKALAGVKWNLEKIEKVLRTGKR